MATVVHGPKMQRLTGVWSVPPQVSGQEGKRQQEGNGQRLRLKVEWFELTHRLVALVKTVGALHCSVLSQHEKKSALLTGDC